MALDPSQPDAGVVIVGAGHAGGRAAEQLRCCGYAGKITLIGQEEVAPYERPSLSKGVLIAPGAEVNAFLFGPDWYAQNNVSLLKGMEVTGVAPDTKTVQLSDSSELDFERLILATGAKLRRLDVPGSDLQNIYYLKTMEDAKSLRDKLAKGTRLVIIGGGFIGLEVAASARSLGADVTVVEATDRLMGRAVPPVVSIMFERIHASRGIEIALGRGVQRMRGESSVEDVILDDGTKLPADLVVIGVGVEANTELAERAGLTVDRGIVVNDVCQSSDPAIFAIGDVACQTDAASGLNIRTESWQNAETQAARAAAVIAGQGAPESEPLWFWSDQDDMNLQIAGRPPDWDDLLMRGTPKEGPFLLFRMDGVHIVAAIGINAKREMLLVRKLLKAGRPIDPAALTNTDIPFKKTVLAALRA